MNRAEVRSARLLAPFLTRHWRALAASGVSTVVRPSPSSPSRGR